MIVFKKLFGREPSVGEIEAEKARAMAEETRQKLDKLIERRRKQINGLLTMPAVKRLDG